MDDDEMTGLVVKGTTALFLKGPDPGADAAVGLVNRYKTGTARSFENKLNALNIEHVGRPVQLSRLDLAWAYVFVALTEGDESRLEPGPFDPELAGVVQAIEADQLLAPRRPVC
jgi:hypothetical protein